MQEPLHLEPHADVGEECTFCHEFVGDVERSRFFHVLGKTCVSRTLYRGEGVRVVPSVGPLVVGHVLLVPEHHVTAFALLDPASLRRAERVHAALRAALGALFGDVVSFEHGSMGRGASAGCCVEHAHLHVVPATAAVDQWLTPRFQSAPVEGLIDLRRHGDRREEYVYVEAPSGTARTYRVNNPPSQMLRQLIALAIGHVERWDWRTDPAPERMRETMDALSGLPRMISARLPPPSLSVHPTGPRTPSRARG